MNSKIIYSIFLGILIISCKEKAKENLPKKIPVSKVQKTKDKPVLPEDYNQGYSQSLKQYFKNYKIYPLEDTIKVDFNGDQTIDKAFFNSKKNIIIKDGKSGKETMIKNASDNDFDWVEYWAVTNDKKTFEITIVNYDLGSEVEIPLEYPSIIIRKEGIGGVITFKNGEYTWIHQAD